MKYINMLTKQFKNCNLTVKYSDSNNNELACVWEDTSNDESLLVIYKIKVDGDALRAIGYKDTEYAINIFLNPSNEKVIGELQLERLKSISCGDFQSFKAFKTDKRGLIVSNDFGF
jgi:hypothetical protein